MSRHVLKELEVIVHQDEILRIEGFPIHPLQKILAAKRQARWLNRADASVGVINVSHRESDFDNSEVAKRDLQKCNLLQQLFGDRYFGFFRTDLPSADQLQERFENRGVALDPFVRLSVYGEIYGGCPQLWGGHLAETLAVPDSRVHPLAEYSLDYDQLDAIRSWRKAELEAFKLRMLR